MLTTTSSIWWTFSAGNAGDIAGANRFPNRSRGADVIRVTYDCDFAEAIEKGLSGTRALNELPIEKARRDEPLPLSFAQQRLWFLDQLNPNSAVYNVPMAVRLQGPMEISALEQALSEIFRRHESLRTVFTVTADQPRQVIKPATQVEIPITDLTNLDQAEREAEALRLVDEEAKRPMDLANGPLLRFSLLPGSKRSHRASYHASHHF